MTTKNEKQPDVLDKVKDILKKVLNKRLGSSINKLPSLFTYYMSYI